MQTANGDNRLLLGLSRRSTAASRSTIRTPITNTFTIRKVRPTFSGRVARYFDFKVMPDFGNGTPSCIDAYFDIRFSPKFRVRTGKDKTPVGYELLIGDAFLLFPERSLASSLVPNRDVGVQVQGDLGRQGLLRRPASSTASPTARARRPTSTRTTPRTSRAASSCSRSDRRPRQPAR